MDGPIDRRRAKGRCGRKKIELKNGYPLNPEGRTGVWFDNFTEGFRKIEVLEDGMILLLRRNVSSKKVEKVLNRLQKYSFQITLGTACRFFTPLKDIPKLHFVSQDAAIQALHCAVAVLVASCTFIGNDFISIKDLKKFKIPTQKEIG
ncbi:hypothetical protein M514_18598 [Trichuris suis]|uniref:Uncharacterized protein n=1 Tax=Trichuris suis TaxID=68888 RepID=A0A085NID3_9BILA|nr:hypothetical protein M514_18598 [Trichuris suis]